MRGRPNHEKDCTDCGARYMPTGTRQQLCPDCGTQSRCVGRRLEPSKVEQLVAILRPGPLTRQQITRRLRDSTPRAADGVIRDARRRGLIELRPDEGWALVQKQEAVVCMA